MTMMLKVSSLPPHLRHLMVSEMENRLVTIVINLVCFLIKISLGKFESKKQNLAVCGYLSSFAVL